MSIQPGSELARHDGVVVKVAEITEEEATRIGQFNTEIHHEPLHPLIRRLFLEHPSSAEMLWFYIEEENSQQILSSLGLMPLEWTYGSITLPGCEMGFVGTLPEFRGRGFIGLQNKFYEQAMRERGYYFSALRGIPFYYRRLGYGFALPLETQFHLPLSGLPPKSDTTVSVTIREAKQADVPAIEQFYNTHNQEWLVYAPFDPRSFAFRFMNNTFGAFHFVTYLLEENSTPVGYFCAGIPFGRTEPGLIQVSDVSLEQMAAIARFFRDNAAEIRQKMVNQFQQEPPMGGETTAEDLVLTTHPDSKFGKWMESLGGAYHYGWAWQVKIPLLREFLQRICPVLEQRIAVTSFETLSRDLRISNYRETATLHFTEGHIREISGKLEYPGHDVEVRIPQEFLVRLLFCDRSADEIQHIITDAQVSPEVAPLVDVLFPHKPSFPDTWY